VIEDTGEITLEPSVPRETGNAQSSDSTAVGDGTGWMLAIDPGPVESAWVVYDTTTGKLAGFAKEPNAAVLALVLSSAHLSELAVEMIASYGMAVGREVFETCVWIGRFVQAWQGGAHRFVYRRDVKIHLCGSMKAKDANVRQALLDLYGGKDKAVGKKASPGPLYGVSSDVWSALAVAVTASAAIEQEKAA
jgi:hypothetical protein